MRWFRGGFPAVRFGVVMVLACLAVVAVPAAPARAGATFDRVKADGIVRCGVTRSGQGLSEIGPDGTWQGFFVDFCRAIAAAMFDDPEAIQPVEVDDVIRFRALADDAFDVLMANTTWTIGRDTAMGMTFAGTVYYDGQGFLAHRSTGATNLTEVHQGTICVTGGTTTIKNLNELTAGLDARIKTRDFNSIEVVYESFFARLCDIITYDRIALIAQLYSRANEPDRFVLFPEVVSKEPLGPVVRQGDIEWFNLVRWVVLATVAAEDLGITRGNVAAMANGDNPEARRLLGTEASIGEGMGVAPDWAARIIRHVGNYAEIYDRHLGRDGLKLQRGLNALWRDGGLLYAPPIR